MALTVKKKSSYIFSPPSYIKKTGAIESTVEKIINDTIKEKIFNLLDINRVIYIRKVEYFTIFTTSKERSLKTIKSIMMRVKNKHNKFRELSTKEIELSGINVKEFKDFLVKHGAKKISNYSQQLENL